jgi:hypothetical protein
MDMRPIRRITAKKRDPDIHYRTNNISAVRLCVAKCGDKYIHTPSTPSDDIMGLDSRLDIVSLPWTLGAGDVLGWFSGYGWFWSDFVRQLEGRPDPAHKTILWVSQAN